MAAKIFTFPGASPLALDLAPPPTLGPAPDPSPPPSPEPEPLPLRRPPRALTEAEWQLQLAMLDAYFRGARLAQGHDAKTIRRDRGYAEQFLAYVGQPLWEMEPDDFSAWAGTLGERGLANSTQRLMQTSVATFVNWVIDHPTYQHRVHALCGGRVDRFITRANRIVHRSNDRSTIPRRYLTAEEFDALSRMFELVVEIAACESRRQLKVFQRDRAMIYSYYAYGMRLAEGHGLDLGRFSPNPDLPELGRFGTVLVFGKGSAGSGPKPRQIPALLPDVRAMLEWYLEEVRPRFPRKNSDEQAMWLSERGTRLARPSIADRYKKIMAACGLPQGEFHIHGLRHMYVSHNQAANVPTSYTAKAVGHADTAMTARYTHLSDDYLRAIAVNVVRGVLSQDDT